MKQLTSTEWIAHFLALETLPRSKSLVMTVMGDAIAPTAARSGWAA
jgi:phenylacetic acid degradation operon negative regulatory protein